MAHSRDAVTLPSQIQPSIPDDIEQIVLRCLAKRPEDRYQSMQEVLNELRLLKEGKIPQAAAETAKSAAQQPTTAPTTAPGPTTAPSSMTTPSPMNEGAIIRPPSGVCR